MSFVPELQQPLWLCSCMARGELDVVAVVRHSARAPRIPSPIGRSASDVLSYTYVSPPSPTYELTFGNVMVSAVSEEFAFRNDDSAVGEGKQFARYERSSFLAFMGQQCNEADVLRGNRFHYVLSCLNGRVDVVAREAPSIRYLGETSL